MPFSSECTVTHPHNWRILASRPLAQNSSWSSKLQAAGYRVLALPLLAIAQVQEPAQQQSIKNCILDFDHYDAVIFVSQNAVEATWQWLDQYWPQLPQGITYYAVGIKTAAQVQHFLGSEATVHAALTAMNTEELLALPGLQQVAHQRILICRGLGGRPRLGDELENRGAAVTYCELYQRTLPAEAVTQFTDANLNPAQDVLCVFSGETLQNLLYVATTAGADLSAFALVVPGERVAALAAEQGFQQIQIARNAGEAAMLAAIDKIIATLDKTDL